MTEYIKNIDARQVLDSRGNPTIYTCVETDKNKGVSIVPSGASTGSREALELRDSTDLFNGKSVNKAVNNIKEILSPLLNGLDICNQEEIDNLMIDKDGTESKSTIGANANSNASKKTYKHVWGILCFATRAIHVYGGSPSQQW